MQPALLSLATQTISKRSQLLQWPISIQETFTWLHINLQICLQTHYIAFLFAHNKTHILSHISIPSRPHVRTHADVYRTYISAKYVHTCPHINSPVGALACHPAFFPMRACRALWLAVMDDGRGEADHLGGPIYAGRKSNQVR